MRYVMPQSALVTTARTQIGRRPLLSLSVGVGFRLSDPLILVHQTAVWQALATSGASMPLYEAAMPKRFAEWLLVGHGTHALLTVPHSRQVDWVSSVELDGVRKSVSCSVRADELLCADTVVRLAIDSVHAASGSAGDNPGGMASSQAPLQRVTKLGVRPDPLAAMGIVGTDWPVRRRWAPSYPRSIEAMAQDGSHMGWPEATDLRYFQQGAPNQWSRHDCFACGASFLLTGMGPSAEGYAGRLPALAPTVLVQREAANEAESVSLKQQTVWFLPDSDIGVIWWNGAVELEYILDDSLSMLLVAFKDRQETVDVGSLLAFAERRSDRNALDPMNLSDAVLMPSMDVGWVWDLILAREDHPENGLTHLNREAIATRLSTYHAELAHAAEELALVEGLDMGEALERLPEIPPEDARDWRDWLVDHGGELRADVTIRDADLTGVQVHHIKLNNVRFERCKLDGGLWNACEFTDVSFSDCQLVETKVINSVWQGGTLERSCCICAQWQNVTLEAVSMEACQVDAMIVTGGAWSEVMAQKLTGRSGCMRDMKWGAVSLTHVDMREWVWKNLETHNLNIIESQMTRLSVSTCIWHKTSVLSSDLSQSQWRNAVIEAAVFSFDTSLREARFVDCVFRRSSWKGLRADRIHMEHCALAQLHAEHLMAEDSYWTHVVLDEANFNHGKLAGSSFDRCSFKCALLYGADLRHTRAENCNFIRAQLSWTYPPDVDAWRNNLITRWIDVPGRKS